MLSLKSVHHIAIICSNYELSKQFYTQTLGFTVINELAIHGVVCEPIRLDHLTNRRFTFFSDPDGLPLELYEE